MSAMGRFLPGSYGLESGRSEGRVPAGITLLIGQQGESLRRKRTDFFPAGISPQCFSPPEVRIRVSAPLVQKIAERLDRSYLNVADFAPLAHVSTSRENIAEFEREFVIAVADAAPVATEMRKNALQVCVLLIRP
jgi:hypothetical protein